MERTTSIRLDDKLRLELEKEAVKLGRSLAGHIRYILTNRKVKK